MVSDLGIGLLVALVTFQTLVAYQVYRDQTDDSTTAPDATADATTTHGSSDVVTCPDCGAENEAGYRYCRGCVGELPGRTTIGNRRERPRGRVVR